MTWPFTKKLPTKKPTQEDIDEAFRKNKEAKKRLDRALEKMPFKGPNDLLGEHNV